MADDDNILRRVPKRARGQARVALILDASAELFARQGIESTTTNEIAAHAGISIGSLYQFFPNKDAIVEALARRYAEELRGGMDHVIAETADTPLPVVFDALLDALRLLHEKHPGFPPLFYGAYSAPGLHDASAELHAEVIARIDALLAAHLPALPPDDRHLRATAAVAVVKAMLAAPVDPADADRWHAELKALVRAYIASML
jgi:AcrR family transcriptional regulator